MSKTCVLKHFFIHSIFFFGSFAACANAAQVVMAYQLVQKDKKTDVSSADLQKPISDLNAALAASDQNRIQRAAAEIVALLKQIDSHPLPLLACPIIDPEREIHKPEALVAVKFGAKDKCPFCNRN